MLLLPQFPENKYICKIYLIKKFKETYKNYNINKLQEKIPDFSYYEPVGLSYIICLATFLKRTVNVWSNGCVIYSFGKYSEKPTINVEYSQNDLLNNASKVGHYTLKNLVEPNVGHKYPNNCLFDAIAPQIGIEANVLRRLVTRRLRRKFKNQRVANSFSNNVSSNTFDILGGARYIGKSKKDAKSILDLSQKGKSHPDKRSGHPRGHASNLRATGLTDSIENYSIKTWKTGFLSQSDQDFVAHLALKTIQAQDKIRKLNENGNFRISVTIPVKDLDVDEDQFPKMQEWLNGKKIGIPYKINKLTLVMRHFYNKHKDPKHDVFILSFYPVL